MDKVRIIIIYTLINCFIFLICYEKNFINYTDIKLMGVIGYIMLYLSILSWKKIHGKYLGPYTIFLIAAYIFTFGQSLLLVFNAVSAPRDLLNIFTYTDIYNAQCITLFFLGWFHIGALFACNSVIFYSNDHKYNFKDLFKLGTIFCFISFIPFIYTTSENIIIVLKQGYMGLYYKEVKIGLSNIYEILASYMIPGLILLFVGTSNYFYKKVFFSIIILYILINLYLGNRTNAVILIGTLILLYNYFYKTINLKNLVILSFLSILILSFLSVISFTRNDPFKNIDTYSIVLQESKLIPLAMDAISEMGGSMYPLISTMKLVPSDHQYLFGQSYLYSLTSIIPNIGIWDIHPAMKYGNLGDWLQKTQGLSYGPGFSIVAEAYINFGVYGFFILFILGYIFSKLFYKYSYTNTDLRDIVISIIFFYLITATVRNSFLATVRGGFYYILPIYLYLKNKYK